MKDFIKLANQLDQLGMLKEADMIDQYIDKVAGMANRPCQAYIILLQHYRGIKGQELKELQRTLYYSEGETKNQCDIEIRKLMKEEAQRRGITAVDIRKEFRKLLRGKVQLGVSKYPVTQKIVITPPEAEMDYEELPEDDGAASTEKQWETPDPVGNIIGGIFNNLTGKN